MATIVPGLWPPGSVVSITGQVVSGDGHLVGGVASGGQFGVVAPKSALRTGSVPSAAQFGTPLAVHGDAFVVMVVGLVSTPAFGQIGIYQTYRVQVGGVATAQLFGSARPTTIVPVLGITRPAFGDESITGRVICGDGHVVGGGNPLFGFPTIVFDQWSGEVTGVPDRSSFGQIGIKTGPVWIPVLGLGSAQLFGAPDVFIVYLHEFICIDEVLVPSGETDLDLVESGCIDLVLTPA